MSYFMYNNSGTLEPIVYTDGVWIDGNGVRHPRSNFAFASWRTENNVVEVLDYQYDRNTHVAGPVTGYTDNGDGTFTEQRTTTPKSLDRVKAVRVNEVLRKRQAVMRGGVTTMNKPISTAESDIDALLLMAATLALGNRPFPVAGVVFYTMEGERVVANETQFKQGVDDIALHFYNTDVTADAHIAAIEALTTSQEIIDYDINTGWPTNPVVDSPYYDPNFGT